MGELKPIGSEKLKGDEKIQRILDLTYYDSDKNLTESKASQEIIKEGKSGVYGIEKEKDGYYVKKGLNENSLDYIGGIFMKNKNRFKSYSEALKKMEFLVEQELAEEKKIIEEEKEVVEEATKYVLKQNKPAAPVPAPAPVAPAPEPAAVDPGLDAELPPEAPAPEGEVGEADSYMDILKKYAGKLQEKFEEYSEEIKSNEYVEILNQVISGIDLEKIEDADVEEIISSLEDVDDEVPAEEPLPAPDDTVPPQETAETDDIDGIASLEELIDTPLDYEDDEEYDDVTDGFFDSFLDDAEIKKAGKLAKKDMAADEPVDFEDEVEEQMAFSGPAEEEEVKEIDLEELQDLLNNSVKHSLGKYFE